LWNEALKTATYVLHRVPTKAVSKTPFELWKGWKPSLRHVHVWCCSAEVRIHNAQEKKLEPRTVSGAQEQSVDISLAMQKSLRDTDFIILLV